MYLGWPRSASTWLYQHLLKINAQPINNQKESHLWYTDPKLALEKYKETNSNIVVDFSTNNWSMNLSSANIVANLFDYFILVHRDPREVVSSYFFNQTTWENWQNTCLHNNLCKTNDIYLRWKSIAGSKLKVYEYTDIKRNPQDFLNSFCDDLYLDHIEIDDSRPNRTKQQHLNLTNQKLIDLIDKQEELFYKNFKRQTNED